jgi:geranylgeranyl diphosphate synthase type I
VSFDHVITELVHQIDAELREIIRSPHHSLASYYGMLQYHLGWVDEQLRSIETVGGKRLRPLLCVLTCEALGGTLAQALPAACAIELIHSFSLVHDDIQDGSQIRRGRRAVWDVWGMDQGINVGDGLFAIAHLALHRMSDRDVSSSRQLAASQALGRACLALCEGQFFDMAFEGHLDVDQEQYLSMIRRKTGALVAAATEVGAIVATDDARTIELCRQFGEHLGLAFQIQDDILGIWGDEQLTGKSAASDIRDRKKTLPVVYALNQPHERRAAAELFDLYAGATSLDTIAIQAVLEILDSVGARQHAEEMALRYLEMALRDLEETGIDDAARANLREIASSLVGRQK